MSPQECDSPAVTQRKLPIGLRASPGTRSVSDGVNVGARSRDGNASRDEHIALPGRAGARLTIRVAPPAVHALRPGLQRARVLEPDGELHKPMAGCERAGGCQGGARMDVAATMGRSPLPQRWWTRQERTGGARLPVVVGAPALRHAVGAQRAREVQSSANLRGPQRARSAHIGATRLSRTSPRCSSACAWRCCVPGGASDQASEPRGKARRCRKWGCPIRRAPESGRFARCGSLPSSCGEAGRQR